jgi:hypothetical protein
MVRGRPMNSQTNECDLKEAQELAVAKFIELSADPADWESRNPGYTNRRFKFAITQEPDGITVSIYWREVCFDSIGTYSHTFRTKTVFKTILVCEYGKPKTEAERAAWALWQAIGDFERAAAEREECRRLMEAIQPPPLPPEPAPPPPQPREPTWLDRILGRTR